MVEVKPGYREPLNLYLICPLEPGERKSTTVATCTFPLVEWGGRPGPRTVRVGEGCKV